MDVMRHVMELLPPPLCHCDPLLILLLHVVPMIEPILCLGDSSVAGILSVSMLCLSSHVYASCLQICNARSSNSVMPESE